MGFSDSSPTSPKTIKEEDKKKNKGSANLIKDGDIDESDSTTTISSSSSVITLEDESVVDVSGQSLELSLPDNNFSDQDSVKNLYFFRNVFTLIPKSVGAFGSLKKLKFFSNEIDLFPPELGSLVDLEHLQVKISSPSLLGEGLSWEKLKALKELELTKVPKRSSALTLLSEISGLKSLTRLSVSHFSIRYLPAEIGCLTSLEYLDLSFNKIKSLPNEISYLTSLTFLKVAHNRLIQLPSVLALLQNLETLDVSNNRLTTLDPLDLSLMPTLQILNLQFNKLPCCCSIPAWIQCNLGGNYEEMGVDTCSSMSEMDVYETPYENNTITAPHKGSHRNPLIMSAGASSISRCFSARKSSKRWKRRQHYYQQRARQERLNSSRKWKGEVPPEELNLKKMYVVEETGKHGMVDDSICLDDNYKLLQESETEVSVVTSEVLPESSLKKSDLVSDSSQSKSERDNKECCEVKVSSSSPSSSSERKKLNHKSKRCYDEDLDNPKASKCHRPSTDTTNLSYKYSNSSFCSTEDSLPDGFFDAGRDRPFMPLSRYEKVLPLESREVILLDRAKDEELDAITSSARALVARLKKLNRLTASDVDNNLQVASYLALFVSDHFGGSDRTSVVQTTRKAASGSNYQKPFICTCLTGNQDDLAALNKQVSGSAQDVSLSEVCETSLRSIKSKRNSIVVPLGKLQFGICRHRALLMKFLCDRMEPPVPCELVRGYLDFMPHAWNVVPVKRGDSWVRMVVDACRPHDIREITDQEYFCRYIPLNRLSESICKRAEVEPGCCSISSLSTGEGVERANSSLIRCKLGSTSAALKMRTLEVSGASSVDDIRTFEYTCLGEVRILGALKHDCIVELYGHEISSKWITSDNGNEHRRILQSSILMEYIEGGSLLDPSSPSSVGTQRAAMTLPPVHSVHSRGKREQIGVFDYTDEDEHVEEMSKKLLRKFDSPGTTSKPPRALDKYDFLRFFSVTQGTQGESKALNHHRVIDVEVPAKEERLRCEPSGYNKTCDLIDVTSDDSHGRIGVNSSSSSENDDASKGEEATSITSGSREVDSENSHVLIIPDFIIYGDIYCTNSKLTFSRNCMSLESSSVNATKGTFSCKWAIEDIVRIESQWCSEVETAVVNVLLKSRDPNEVDNAKEISGIDLLKFSVYDAKSFKEVEAIKLLDSRYKDIWFDTITESEESACSGHNLETSLTNLAGSFEDLVYPQGEPDAVVVRKQDIELLKPRRFINDTIIDFYIKYLKSRIRPEERGRFHFFNCFFFRKLANLDKGSPSSFGGREAYQRVQKWTKNVELFEKDYIFIPINFSFHWSLIIICHPGELVPSSVENPSRVPCILHLDSIKGSHKGGLVNIFPSYLREEWKARQGNTTDLSRASNMQLISLELPQQENSFDCGLFLLHYLELFVTRAPAKFNPSLITRSEKFLTRKWFPAKEASLKRGYILELLYNLHKGHDPSILPANSNSKPPHFRVSNKNDEENESRNVTETCKWRKPVDGSSSIVTYIPQTKTCLPDQILSKECFYAGGYDLPEASKRRKSFMSPIVEEVHESGEKEEIHLPMDTEESICQEMETLRKEECMLYIEDTDDDEAVSVEYVPDSQDSYEVEMKEDEEEDDELILFTGASKEIHKTRETKSASAWIEKGVHKSKSRALAARSCCNNILLVLSDDEGSSAGSYELQNKENISSSSCNVMAKRPKT